MNDYYWYHYMQGTGSHEVYVERCNFVEPEAKRHSIEECWAKWQDTTKTAIFSTCIVYSSMCSQTPPGMKSLASPFH